MNIPDAATATGMPHPAWALVGIVILYILTWVWVEWYDS